MYTLILIIILVLLLGLLGFSLLTRWALGIWLFKMFLTPTVIREIRSKSLFSHFNCINPILFYTCC